MKSIGIDIENIARFKKMLSHISFENYSGVLDSIFTENEKQYCLNKRLPYKHFAVRFAGKEAFLKALGTGLRGKMQFSDVEYVVNDIGKPIPHCTGEVLQQVQNKEITQMDVSFSHNKDQAIAIVMLESKS